MKIMIINLLVLLLISTTRIKGVSANTNSVGTNNNGNSFNNFHINSPVNYNANPYKSYPSDGVPPPTTMSEPVLPSTYQPRTMKDFKDISSRKGFIRKVYAIFSSQMTCTILVTAIIMSNPKLARYLQFNFKTVSLVSFLGSTAAVMSLVASPKLRYKAPYNFMILFLHALLQSVTIGTLSSLFNPRLVCLGTIHTLVAFLALTAYSFYPTHASTQQQQTTSNRDLDNDLTTKGSLLLTASSCFLVGIFLNTFFQMPLIDNLISAGLAMLSAVYIAYDTKKIVGGTHNKYSYAENEYILAALSLYQDVLNLFLYILSILAKLDKERD